MSAPKRPRVTPLQKSIEAQVRLDSVGSLAPAVQPLRQELTPAFPLSFCSVQEKSLAKAYTEVTAAHQQQLHQLEFARKMLEKVQR